MLRSRFTPLVQFGAFLVRVLGDVEPDIITEVADLHDGVPPGLVYFNQNGIYCKSVASDFYTTVTLEVHDQEPMSVGAGWEELGRGVLDVSSGGLRVDELIYEGDDGITFAPGAYQVAVRCRDRTAPPSPFAPDGSWPTGPEQWLVQLWPAA